MSKRYITLAITVYNRYDLLLESFAQVIDDERISEIIIVDDASTDGSGKQIEEYFEGHEKVKVYINDINLDCYFNKRKAVKLSSNEQLILLDSDNIITKEYIDKLYEIQEWHPDVIVQPSFAKPHFDFTAFSSWMITKENVAGFMDKPMFSTMLNAFNFFLNKNKFLECWDGKIDPHTADSIYHNYNHLASGGCIYVQTGLWYEHRIHNGSHYKNNVHKTGEIYQDIENKLRQLK